MPKACPKTAARSPWRWTHRTATTSTRLSPYKSTDGGLTWKRTSDGIVPGRMPMYLDTLVIDPSRPSTVFAGEFNQLFRSDDGGATWTRQPLAVSKIVFHPRRAGLAYGVGREALYKSTNGGFTWQPLARPGFDVWIWNIAADSTRDGVLYIAAEALFRSTDDGASWQRVALTGPIRAVAADPQFPIAYASTGDGLVRSSDGFNTWTAAGPPRMAFFRALALGPDARDRSRPAQLFVGTQASNDVFVIKLDVAGSVVYATYVGGAADETASAMAVGPDGSVFVTGATWSADFPATEGAYRTSLPNNNPFGPTGAFVFRLAPDGSRLVYSTVLARMTPAAIAADTAGSAYIAGSTFGGIPITPGVVQPDWRGFPGCGTGSIAPCFPTPDGFVMKLDPSGSCLVYSTYLGEGQDRLSAIAVDPDGNAYVAGIRIWKLNPTATSLLYRVPGLGAVAALALDAGRNLFLTGSAGWPGALTTPNAFQRYPRGPVYLPPGSLSGPSPVDAYVARLGGDGALLYSTLLSGESQDAARSLAVDAEGNAVVAGITESQGLPTLAPLQGGFSRHTGFVAKFNGNGSELIYSTFVGDDRPFEVKGVVLDPADNPVFAGNTLAPEFRNFPVSYAPGPPSDVFVARLEVRPEVPEVRLDAVLNAASLLGTPLSPGGRITVSGLGIAGEDVRLLLDDALLPIVSAEAGRITAIVPDDIDARPAARVQVEAGGRRSNVVLMPTAPLAPAIYTADGSGFGQGLILNEDGTRNSPENPAAPDSIVTIFCNGIGRTTLENGYAVPATPVSVFIDGFYSLGVDAHIEEAPGLAGEVFQIRVHVPNPKLPDFPNFKMPPIVAVTLDVGGVPSQPGVSMAIRQ